MVEHLSEMYKVLGSVTGCGRGEWGGEPPTMELRLNRQYFMTREMGQWVKKKWLQKPDDLSSIPRTHLNVEERV